VTLSKVLDVRYPRDSASLMLHLKSPAVLPAWLRARWLSRRYLMCDTLVTPPRWCYTWNHLLYFPGDSVLGDSLEGTWCAIPAWLRLVDVTLDVTWY